VVLGLQDQQVSGLSDLDRADFVEQPERPRGVGRCGDERLSHCQMHQHTRQRYGEGL
jgi:hypothetical protein